MLDQKWMEYLTEQTKTKYEFKDVNKAELVELLFQHIGDSDPHVRDDLVYPNLAHLLYDGHFNESELAMYMHQLMGEEYLFFDLDNYIENSVLTRSFSLLQLVVLSAVHNRDNIISVRSMKSLMTRFLDYVDAEQIYTGYKPGVGFVHTIAHSADLFHQLMKVEAFGEIEIKRMMSAISSTYRTKDEPYTHDEDERMVVAIKAALDRGVLDQQFITQWVDSFSSYTKPKTFPQRYYLTNNIKNLLRSLYFKILPEDQYDYLKDVIVTALTENVTLR